MSGGKVRELHSGQRKRHVLRPGRQMLPNVGAMGLAGK